MKRGILLLSLILILLFPAASAYNPCADIECSDYCYNDVLHHSGECKEGDCVYQTTECDHGCSEGECLECLGNDDCENICKSGTLFYSGECRSEGCKYQRERSCIHGCNYGECLACGDWKCDPDCLYSDSDCLWSYGWLAAGIIITASVLAYLIYSGRRRTEP